MFIRIGKVVMLLALLSAFAASSAPVFSRGGDHDFCGYGGLDATNCVLRADGSCYTQKCANPLNGCVYSYCARK